MKKEEIAITVKDLHVYYRDMNRFSIKKSGLKSRWSGKIFKAVKGECDGRDYYIEYQMDDGNKVECQVDKKVYNQLNKGDMGIISYCGMKYLGFRKAC